MLKLQSPPATVPADAGSLYQRLRDLPRLRSIMPESVERFEADEQSFLFGIKGLPDVRLLLDEEACTNPTEVVFKSASSKLDFVLKAVLKDQGEETTLYYDFEGDFNPMLKMMAQRPLKSFIDELAQHSPRLAEDLS